MTDRPGIDDEDDEADRLARQVVDRMVASDGVADLLGLVVEEVAAGRAVVSLALTSEMLNGHGIGHGGIVFTLADAAFAFACNSHGDVTVAQGADITFLAPAHVGDVLVATAAERRRVGRTGLTDVTVVRRGDAVVVAEFRGRSRRLDGRVLDDDDAPSR